MDRLGYPKYVIDYPMEYWPMEEFKEWLREVGVLG